MLMIEKLAEVPKRLTQLYINRLRLDALPNDVSELRGPVGLFLVREDGGNGSKLAKEVVGSFGYWDSRSAHYFDGVFLGWGFDGIPVFSDRAFAHCIRDLERELKWKYKGGCELLLTDFVFDPRQQEGHLDFSSVIPLDISGLLEEKKLSQLSSLMEELIAPVTKDRSNTAETSVFDISAYIAILRTRKFVWQELIKKIGVILGWVDLVAPYAVQDLRRAK